MKTTTYGFDKILVTYRDWDAGVLRIANRGSTCQADPQNPKRVQGWLLAHPGVCFDPASNSADYRHLVFLVLLVFNDSPNIPITWLLIECIMRPQPLNTSAVSGRDNSLLSPSDYDNDAASIRSDQDTDSDDDERQLRARNSRELRAHDRLVLMEEDEMDQLVVESRRRQERGRRGSGIPIPIPNPLSLFGRRNSDLSLSGQRSPSAHLAPGSSTEDLVLEKRSLRRARRKAKKNRLLTEAEHGEDGELMYEMEEGGMKEGSSTGESSDRDDSDEVDRKGLLHLADAKSKRTRTCRRWLLVHAIIAVAFTILVLLAWKLSIERKRRPHADASRMVSNGTALFAPTTIIISLDGFRADFLNRGLTPRLNAMIGEGVSPLYMLVSTRFETISSRFILSPLISSVRRQSPVKKKHLKISHIR